MKSIVGLWVVLMRAAWLLELIGAALVVYGVSLWSEPAAWVVSGVAVLAKSFEVATVKAPTSS